MKKLFQISLIAAILALMSCEKEIQVLESEAPVEILKSQFQNEGKFKKEIIVTDDSGKNQAFYAIYSDDEQLLTDYLKANQMSLKINNKEFDEEESFFPKHHF